MRDKLLPGTVTYFKLKHVYSRKERMQKIDLLIEMVKKSKTDREREICFKEFNRAMNPRMRAE